MRRHLGRRREGVRLVEHVRKQLLPVGFLFHHPRKKPLHRANRAQTLVFTDLGKTARAVFLGTDALPEIAHRGLVLGGPGAAGAAEVVQHFMLAAKGAFLTLLRAADPCGFELGSGQHRLHQGVGGAVQPGNRPAALAIPAGKGGDGLVFMLPFLSRQEGIEGLPVVQPG